MHIQDAVCQPIHARDCASTTGLPCCNMVQGAASLAVASYARWLLHVTMHTHLHTSLAANGICLLHFHLHSQTESCLLGAVSSTALPATAEPLPRRTSRSFRQHHVAAA